MKAPINELEKNAAVIAGLESMAAQAVDDFLVDPQQCWQPTDFLPDMTQADAL